MTEQCNPRAICSSVLLAHKQAIEGGLGFVNSIGKSYPNAKAVRIASWYQHASIEDEQRWPEYLGWLARRLGKMDAVLRPLMKALP